jgi:hypothetical protein
MHQHFVSSRLTPRPLMELSNRVQSGGPKNRKKRRHMALSGYFITMKITGRFRPSKDGNPKNMSG